jgi:hypothetical protein
MPIQMDDAEISVFVKDMLETAGNDYDMVQKEIEKMGNEFGNVRNSEPDLFPDEDEPENEITEAELEEARQEGRREAARRY